MSATRYTASAEPVTQRDWVGTYARRAFERVGEHLARQLNFDLTATRLLEIARAYAIVLDMPMSDARFDLHTTRANVLANIAALDSLADRRLAGLATAEEHIETLGALAEFRHLLTALDTVLADIES